MLRILGHLAKPHRLGIYALSSCCRDQNNICKAFCHIWLKTKEKHLQGTIDNGLISVGLSRQAIRQYKEKIESSKEETMSSAEWNERFILQPLKMKMKERKLYRNMRENIKEEIKSFREYFQSIKRRPAEPSEIWGTTLIGEHIRKKQKCK
jgi:hypothetical protein